MLSLKQSQGAAVASKLGVASTKFVIASSRLRSSSHTPRTLSAINTRALVRSYAKKSKSGSKSSKKPTATGSSPLLHRTSNPALNGLLNGSESGKLVDTALNGDKGRKKGSVSIEELYQKKTPIEHILLRPDTYIGSLVKTKQPQWVYHGSKGIIAMRECSYVPGLYKIFDEILVNAADQKTRDPRHLTAVRVDIDVNQGIISVFNDGAGIPVQIHREENVYLPELLLGHLLTGSNFDDSVAKVTGGRNGYGAKLANIFSEFFCVETFDEHTGLYYKQRWENHMQTCMKPEILQNRPRDVLTKGSLEAANAPESAKAISTDSRFYYGESGGFTRITFKPDLNLFSMKKLGSDDIVQLMKRRVYDLAACLPGVKVFLDGAILPSNFEHLYSVSGADLVTSDVNQRWTVGIGASAEPSNLTQISFVNCIHTLNGGTHVNYIADQIVKYVIDTMKNSRKYKILMSKVTPAQVKNHLILVIKCLIENPAFDSQTKERLMTKSDSFGSTCVLDEKFLKDAVAKTGLIELVASQVEHLQKQQLVRAASATKKNKLLGIPKLDDANEAGGARSKECTLIITEGDSAKSLAVSGLSVVGRDFYGVFPVQGKILNVREAATPKVVENKEIKDLIQAIGLNPQRNYANWETDSVTLRYGKVMLMTDQDPDGSHIKGLLINFIHHFWPNLLKQDGFLFEFVTPLIKATKKSTLKRQEEEFLASSADEPAPSESEDEAQPSSTPSSKPSKSKKSDTTLSFFSMAEYEKWKKTVDVRNWHIKYYKGLGTNTSAEAKEYFSNLRKHVVKFEWKPEADALIDMAFNKKFAAERRMWLLGYDSNAFVDTSKGILDYASFINKELIAFSAYDNLRSIPSVIDGLKPSQRKVLFASFKRKLTSEIKVVQLAGYVSEQAGYHHGEQSLHGTIVNMAQQFVGSNNVPLLVPSGQFGTRLQGGKDAASARYIFTRLSRYARLLFPEDDDHLLKYLDDDGFPIEPEHYVPVIPLLLVNGAEGVGTGWSSKVPSYNPLAIIDNIRRLLDQKDMMELTPFYRGFRGYTKRNFGRNALPAGTFMPPSKTSTMATTSTSSPSDAETLQQNLTSSSIVKAESSQALTSTDGASSANASVSTEETDASTDSTTQLPSSWITQGVFTRTSGGQLRVVELPVGRWTNDYKSFLEQLVKEKRYVKEYSEYHTDELVSFLITPTEPEVLDSDKHIIERFKLEDWIHERNMSAFDANGNLQKFSTPLDIIKAHFDSRLRLYEKRKAWKLSQLSHVVKRLYNQTKFTSAVLDGSLLLFNQPKTQVVENLQKMGIPPLDPQDPHSTTTSYSYLLSTPLLHLTREHVEKLQEETKGQQAALHILQGTSPTQLWREDLDKLEAMLLRDPTFSETPLTPGAKPKIPPLLTSSNNNSRASRASSKRKPSKPSNSASVSTGKTTPKSTASNASSSSSTTESAPSSTAASSTPKPKPSTRSKGKKKTAAKGKLTGKQVFVNIFPEDQL